MAEDSFDLKYIRNTSIVTDISALSISICGSSGMNSPKFINVYDLRFESGQKSDFLTICQCFPNLRNLNMSKLVLEETRNLKDALAILPQSCPSMHRGGIRGGGADASPSGIRHPADPKGPPFGIF